MSASKAVVRATMAAQHTLWRPSAVTGTDQAENIPLNLDSHYG